MTEEGTSGKRVVAVLLLLAAGAGLIGWLGAMQLDKARPPEQATGQTVTVLSEGVIFEAKAGDPAVVIAKDVGSGKELWRAELGAISTDPQIDVQGEVVEVQIAGTPWMTLDRTTGEPVE